MKKSFLIAGLFLMGLNAFANECKIYKYSGNGLLYVSINGQDMSNGLSSLNEALDAARELNQAGMCQLPRPKSECKPYRYSGNGLYYISVGGSDITNSISDIDSLTRNVNQLTRAGLCFRPEPREKCEIYRYSGNGLFYIKAGGTDVTGSFPSVTAASSTLWKLHEAGLCKTNNINSTPNNGRIDDNERSDHRDRLGFNFKDRAFQVASTTARVAKAIEPYLNNDQEKQVDELKKAAIRLKTKIQAGASLKDVRSSMFILGSLLEKSRPFIESSLETDNLDSLGEDFLFALESINTMVSFLDNDFKGNRVELY